MTVVIMAGIGRGSDGPLGASDGVDVGTAGDARSAARSRSRSSRPERGRSGPRGEIDGSAAAPTGGSTMVDHCRTMVNRRKD
jgi:hypothetical protein